MSAEPIRIMTFNIHHGKGTDGLVQIQRIADVIRQIRPDIIGLNEVDQTFHARSDFIDQPKQLAVQLGMEYAFAPAIDSEYSPDSQQKGGYGNAILSRFPIRSFEAVRLSAGSEAREPRILLHGKMDVNETPVNIFVTHLSLNPWHHRKQTSEILSVTSSCNHPHVIMGDWNMRPQSRPWRVITASGYQDSWASKGVGAGATFPSGRPFLRLDYIFASSHFEIQRSEVSPFLPDASDHLPVWSELQFK
jgi:endonuclease/exonuclease/phosphatase family metal-dependent hydrolase